MMNSSKHLFHMVDPSPWPFSTAMGAFFFTSGLGFFMHSMEFGGYILLMGLMILILSAFFWFGEVIDESTFRGFHTKMVRNGLSSGFLLFIASEMMLFFGFFWAFFHSSLCTAGEIGYIWPSVGMNPIIVLDYPLLNTGLLMTSGFAVTWAHSGVALGSMMESIDALIVTVLLGLMFVMFQALEYFESSFNISDNIYACVFYMLTGLHGFHVIVGVTYLLISLIRLLSNHYLTNHYLGFVFAIWYWHFVDIVWILLFLTLYGWGTW